MQVGTPAVLAVDQGTTNSKALLVDASGRVVAQGAHPLAPIRTPHPGWFEQDPEDLFGATLQAVAAALDAAGPDVEVVGVALTNQRESVVAWHAGTGEPASAVLGWQDARTAEYCGTLAEAGTLVHERTGLRLDPMFSAPKLRWLLDHTAVSRDRGLRAGTIDAYLIARLTGEDATEAGNASRTLLFDLHHLGWDDELLALFGVTEDVLPPVRASDAGFGTTHRHGPLAAGWPVLAVLGDSHAALFAHGISQGAGKVTYGTGSSVMVPLDGPGQLPDGVSTTLAWLRDDPTYAREGNILATGAALEALAGLLRLDDVGALLELAGSASGEAAVSYVPAFSGLGAPHWDRDATGVLVGLGRGTTAGQVARAGLDAVAQQVCDVLDAVPEPLTRLHADGGLSRHGPLMQLQADLAGLPVSASPVGEASALGAARLAWQALGADDAAWGGAGDVRTYEPRRDEAWRKAERDRWRDALARSRGLALGAGSKGPAARRAERIG
ncbi:MAG: FGGY family carbohydrate kinase [Actinomycetia bacterium]|nr:FGGY family carbohydrate kinase [Actinomycetes bacterium]